MSQQNKDEQKKLLIEIMEADQKNGLYEDHIGDTNKMVVVQQIFNVKEKLPDVEHGSFLVYAPKSFPKNSRWLVAEYYDDVKGFYSESSENFLDDVTHWTTLPDEPIN